jgi:hypothetical protein
LLPLAGNVSWRIHTGAMSEGYRVDIDQCAQCGLVVAEDQFLLAYCGDCGFEYCQDHAAPEGHRCIEARAESAALEEAEAQAE